MKNIGIIGGGASGLIAAITAARMGATVTIIERQNRIGKKILVTGNGRCNLTNTKMAPQYFHSHSNSNSYLPMEHVTLEETLTFFQDLGIELLIENNKIYPASEQANSVLDVMRLELEKLGVEIILEEKIVEIKAQENSWIVRSEQKKTWTFDKVIVATGGKAAPQLGCDDTGYSLLRQLGHTSYDTYPTIVHITSPTSYCKMMKGTRVKGEAKIYIGDKKKRSEYGEILFTEDGLSGPAIFQLSRTAAQYQKQQANKKCKVTIDLFPQQSKDDLIAKMYDRIGRHPHKTIEELYIGWLHKRVVIPVIKEANIGSPTTLCENLDYDMIVQLVERMKNLHFDVTGTRDYKFAQATAGGINIEEVDLETMLSKKCRNLYITGEVLDVDGDCGGYNLQWAWSTGILAGRHSAN